MKEKDSIIDENIQQAVDILNNVNDFNDQTILSKEILRAAAVCRVYDELAFADFRARCKKHKSVTLSIFNDAVVKYSNRVRREFARFEENAKIIQLNITNDNIYALPPLPDGLELNIPPKYTCSTRGIVIDKVTPNGKHKTKFVAYSPFFIIERFKNIDDQTEKYKVAIYSSEGWDFITADRYDFSEEHRLVTLSRYGLGVDSVIARDSVTYISELLRYNLHVIPVKRMVNQIGWRNDFSEFIYPPRGKDYVVDTDGNDEIKLIYQSKGNRQMWLEHYDKIKTYRYARLAFAAALAASFIEIINVRNMTLCIWGRSGGGKTAGVIKFPMSIHGNPKYVPTFNSTFNSLERRVSISNNLPFAVDELQNITSKFQLDNIDKFAHIVGEGISKGRTSRNGDIEILRKFSTIALITGEQPLTHIMSDQGKKRRTIEFSCREVLPREIAEETHEFVTKHFGLIGREWIGVIEDHINEIKAIYKFFKGEFKNRRSDAISDHINFLAAAYTADVVFNVYFRNLSSDVAFNEILNDNQAFRILLRLTTERESSTSERAKAFIREIIYSRKKHFITDAEYLVQDPIFGSIQDDYVTFYPYMLQSELKKAGFSSEKIIEELLNENFLTYDALGQFILNRS